MSHFISLTSAIDLTTTYRSRREDILNPDYQNNDTLALSETFDRDAIDYLLRQEDCVQLRIYYGMDEDSKVHAVIVGVDKENNDMLPDVSNDYKIVELGIRCPPTCPPSSALNS